MTKGPPSAGLLHFRSKESWQFSSCKSATRSTTATLVDIAATTGTGAVAVEGVFSGVPKVTAAVFAQGEKLIWDVSAGKFDDSAAIPATGDVTGGAVAWVAGANLETTCTIKLTAGNATLT